MVTKSKKSGKIVIGMPLKNGAKTLARAIDSVLNQKGLKREVILLIVNDNSSDDWKNVIAKYEEDPRLIIENVNFGKVWAVRNFILDYVRDNIPDALYIGRLDADDFIADEHALSQIEYIADRYSPDVIIAGNMQMLDNRVVGLNKADRRLLDMGYLEKRLWQMANGIWEGELPSCNIFVRPDVEVRYKNIESAEDHWYTVELLLNKHKYHIYIAEDLIYAVYTLNGNLTFNNRKMALYRKSREMLYEYFIKSIRGENTDE